MAFKAQSNTYRVKIKVFQERFDRGFSPWALASAPPPISKVVIMFLNKFVSLLLVISVITVSTPENTDKVITLITNKSDTNVFKNMLTIFTIVDGADAKRFTLKKGNLKVNLLPAKVNLLASAPPPISKVVIMFLNKFVSLLLVISVITLSVFFQSHGFQSPK
jgi:hypothetical protein